MTSIEALVSELVGLDVKLWADDGQLRCSAPRGVMTEALQAILADRKSELLEFLRAADRSPSGGEPPLGAGSRDDPIPLSHGQERIWALAEMRPESSVYNTSTAYRLSGALDVLALERSLSELQRRHEILRTTFPEHDRQPRQHISPHVPLDLPVENIIRQLKRAGAEHREAETLRLLRTEVQRPFDIKRGPLWRPLLLRLAEDEHILSLSIHHLIFDGGSDAVLLRELSWFYESFSEGEGPDLAELPIQYADFACWQQRRLRGEAGERQLAYWTEKLSGDVAPLRLPADRPRSADATFRGKSETFELPTELARALTLLSRDEKAGAFATLLAAYDALLHRYTGQEDLAVCSPFAARDRAELEGLIGYFNNIVVMRADLSGDPSFRELMARIRRLAVEAADNQNLPLQRLVELPNLVRVPLTRGMFCYQDMSTRILDLKDISATPVDLRKETADFDLAMYMQSTEEGKLTGVLEYDAELFDEDTIRNFIRDFQTVLEIVSADPDRLLSELPCFGPGVAEVEAALDRHPQIDQAVVVDHPDRSGAVAYLVLNEDDTPKLDDVRNHARAVLPEYCVPSVFVPLDQMPLRADGRVDRSALPVPAIADERAGTNSVAPRTDLERRLSEIWKRVLWLDRDVGIRDRFTDLGGHSLLSVQLVLELERELQRSLPLSALSRLSTIEEMARILEEDDREEAGRGSGRRRSTPLAIPQETYHALLTYTASWAGERVSPESLLVGLNTEGTREPLFWCLQRYGELTQLAKYLGSAQPVYGMRSGNRVMLKTQVNIGALATHYVSEILAAKPEGPFFLGGNCQAADISFQIAKRLEKLGHDVSLLILLEKFVPQDYGGRIALLFGAKSNRNPYRYYRRPEIGWKKFYTGVHSIDVISGKHSRFFREPNIQVLAETLRRRLEEAQGESARVVTVRVGREVQKLPHAAYRAKLSAQEAWAATPGEEILIPVVIENASREDWRAGEVSGIALANRWLNSKEVVVESCDGRAPLVADLASGARCELALSVRAPRKTGAWILELDLIDEGVTWFGDRGSVRTRLRVDVRRNSRIHSALRTLLRGSAGRG